MNDIRMRELLTSTSDLAKASLATRIFISRLRIEVRAQPTQLAAKMDELKAFIAKNAFALSDLATV